MKDACVVKLASGRELVVGGRFKLVRWIGGSSFCISLFENDFTYMYAKVCLWPETCRELNYKRLLTDVRFVRVYQFLSALGT